MDYIKYIVPIVLAVVTAVFGIIAYFVRREFERYDKRLSDLDADYKRLSDAMAMVPRAIDAAGEKIGLETGNKIAARTTGLATDVGRLEREIEMVVDRIERHVVKLTETREDYLEHKAMARATFLSRTEFMTSNTLIDTKIAGTARVLDKIGDKVDRLLAEAVRQEDS